MPSTSASLAMLLVCLVQTLTPQTSVCAIQSYAQQEQVNGNCVGYTPAYDTTPHYNLPPPVSAQTLFWPT
jgi:hypothetical protein